MVRAKMRVISIEGGTLNMECVYDSECGEDMSFCKATPWGNLSMGIDNPIALEQFAVGQEFYLDFNAVDISLNRVLNTTPPPTENID